MNKKVLILCTGNSCRSQMAEGFLKSFDSSLDVHSAGTFPAKEVNPNSIIVMKEVGISLEGNFPKSVDRFLDTEWDYVITVCDNAKESCPLFTGKVKHHIHIGFEDPADATGSPEEILNEYRRIRDKIKEGFNSFYFNNLKH